MVTYTKPPEPTPECTVPNNCQVKYGNPVAGMQWFCDGSGTCIQIPIVEPPNDHEERITALETDMRGLEYAISTNSANMVENRNDITTIKAKLAKVKEAL